MMVLQLGWGMDTWAQQNRPDSMVWSMTDLQQKLRDRGLFVRVRRDSEHYSRLVIYDPRRKAQARRSVASLSYPLWNEGVRIDWQADRIEVIGQDLYLIFCPELTMIGSVMIYTESIVDYLDLRHVGVRLPAIPIAVDGQLCMELPVDLGLEVEELSYQEEVIWTSVVEPSDEVALTDCLSQALGRGLSIDDGEKRQLLDSLAELLVTDRDLLQIKEVKLHWLARQARCCDHQVMVLAEPYLVFGQEGLHFWQLPLEVRRWLELVPQELVLPEQWVIEEGVLQRQLKRMG